MAAVVDSSDPTSAIRTVLRAGGCGLRQTISNIDDLLTIRACNRTAALQGAGSPLCALRHRTASVFWHLQSGYPLSQIVLPLIPYLTRRPARRSGRNCHMFVKGLSAVLDKE